MQRGSGINPLAASSIGSRVNKSTVIEQEMKAIRKIKEK